MSEKRDPSSRTAFTREDRSASAYGTHPSSADEGHSENSGRSTARQSSGSGLLPAVSLPKGGGALHGIGEKFATNPATGTGSLTIPIATSPGRAGFDLALRLSYDSGAGNGP